MKKKLLVFISFFLLLIPLSAKASIDGFTITNYDVNIVVSDRNVFDITEKITVVTIILTIDPVRLEPTEFASVIFR